MAAWGVKGWYTKPKKTRASRHPTGGTSGDLSIPGYVPKTPVVAYDPSAPPTPVQQAIRSSGGSTSSAALPRLVLQLSDLLSPGPTAKDIAQAAANLGMKPQAGATEDNPLATLLAGVGPKAGSRAGLGDDWKFTKAQLHPNEAEVGEKEIDAPFGGGNAWVLKELNRAIPLARAAIHAGDSDREEAIYDAVDRRFRDAAFGDQPTSGTFVKLTPQQEQKRRQRTQDPLGKKTLGFATVADLVKAGREGKLRINDRGVISTPQVRQAARQLQKARQAARGANGLRGDFGSAQEQFIEGVARGTGLSPLAVAIQAIGEEGHGAGSPAAGYEARGENNFLNVGPGKHYPTVQDAIDQTVATFKNGLYGDVLAAAGKPVAEQLAAIEASPWAGIGGYRGNLQRILQSGEVGYQRDPQAVQRLRQAEAKAADVGLKVPAPGQKQGNVTWVHQTAATTLEWAEKVLGTQEGTPRQLHWSELVGGVTDPWCAVFVSAALKKVGIEPPANPSYSGAFMEGWSGGKKLNSTSLSAAQPGDILIFDWGDGGQTDHVAIYKGGGQMIGGNQSNEVSLEEVPAGNIVGIVRPQYSGKKVPVSDEPVAGGAAATGGSAGGGASGGSAAGGAAAARNARPLVSPSALPISELLQTLGLAPNVEVGAGGEDKEDAIAQLLKELGV